MKTNDEILDEFGEILVRKVYDTALKFIMNSVKDLAVTKGYENLFANMSPVQKKEIEYYTEENLKNALFNFLRIFEEDSQFKLYYEEGGQRVDLAEISEMLKAEPIIDNGWIDRFSNLDKQ
jgi:hypothetical protein